ncbi:MAG: PepSY domain-containing protein [Parvularcula sp.]
MQILKWGVRIHKWVALVIGIQIFLWISGGLVMSFIPIEKVRGEHKIAQPSPVTVNATQLVPLGKIVPTLGLSDVSKARLSRVDNRPVWIISDSQQQRRLVDAYTGARLDPIGQDLARDIATSDYKGQGQIKSSELLVDPPAEYSREGPVWRIIFSDRDATTLYIDPTTAEVRARRSATWRFYDLFWRLHVMDYDDGGSFNHPLLVISAGAAFFVALSGLVILFIKMRRSLIIWRRRR